MWITAAATLAGALIGLILNRNLAALSYRRPEETELALPRPAWWLIPTIALAWGALTWRHQYEAWPILVLWLPISAALGWLSAVDLDVRRLPDAVMLPTAGWVAAIITTDAVVAGDPTPALIATGIGLAAGIGAWILHFLSRGAFGFGDVKLIGLLSIPLASTSPYAVFPALLIACGLAIGSSLAFRQRLLPFGPHLGLGYVALAVAAT